MQDKKGQIPIVILTIGVFVLCILAVISFLNSSINFGGSFTNVGSVEKVNLYVREAQFYLMNGKNPEEIMDIFSQEIILGKFVYSGEKREDGEYFIRVRSYDKKRFFGEVKEVFYFQRSFFE